MYLFTLVAVLQNELFMNSSWVALKELRESRTVIFWKLCLHVHELQNRLKYAYLGFILCLAAEFFYLFIKSHSGTRRAQTSLLFSLCSAVQPSRLPLLSSVFGGEQLNDCRTNTLKSKSSVCAPDKLKLLYKNCLFCRFLSPGAEPKISQLYIFKIIVLKIIYLEHVNIFITFL